MSAAPDTREREVERLREQMFKHIAEFGDAKYDEAEGADELGAVGLLIGIHDLLNELAALASRPWVRKADVMSGATHLCDCDIELGPAPEPRFVVRAAGVEVVE